MLTPRQTELLRYLQSYIEERGYAPTYEDMRKHLRLASRSGIRGYLDALSKFGYIRHLPERPRAIRLLPQGPDSDPMIPRIAILTDDGWADIPPRVFVKCTFPDAEAAILVETDRFAPNLLRGDELFVARAARVDTGEPYFDADHTFCPAAPAGTIAPYRIIGLLRLLSAGHPD